MLLLRRLLLALLLLCPAPALAAGDDGWFYRGSDIARDPAWRFGTLPNGVRYAVRRNPLPAGQVSIRVRIDAGSLHERAEERGWMHLIEHLVFRGTRSFADRQARETWQRLGASFGSDSNASTQPTQTVYQLDLPRNDAASLDASLDLIAEMVDSARFDPAAVAAEQKIVMAEKGGRSELSMRYRDAAWPLVYGGLLMADRDPIGTDATLAAATPAALRALYERWYRPDRATVVLVGDADPAMLEQLVERHFAGWRAEGGPAPVEPDYGAPGDVPARAVGLAYPGAPTSALVSWIRPYRPEPATLAREEQDFAESIAQRILNRRLEAEARGDAAFVGAGVSQNRSRNVADLTQLSVTARGDWQAGLTQAYAILADALASPPSAAEIARELQEIRLGAASGLEGDSTVRSPQRAQQMVNAIDSNDVVTTAAEQLALVDRFAPRMTPARIEGAIKRLFTGRGPRLLLMGPARVEQAALDRALAAAEVAAPARRRADRAVSFSALPRLGAPGREVSRQRLDDLDVTIVRFANGASLVFKRTDFEKGSVSVQLRFGAGLSAIAPRAGLPLWASGIVAPSGLADLDLDSVERLLTGRRIGLSFGIEEDAFALRAATNGADLADQLRLFATKLAHPRWDAALLARVQAATLQSYDLAFASASARAGREAQGIVRGGDARYLPTTRETIAGTGIADVRGLLDPLFAAGPIEGVIVGDVDLETAVAAFARSVGALPARGAASVPPGALTVAPPRASPDPVRFTHTGDPAQAYALIGWTTFGGTADIKARRALSVAANIIRARLFDELREAEGASYSPGAGLSFSETFPGWGILQASSELRPESVPTFFRIARRIVAEMAQTPVPADEFARAQNPITSGIPRTLRTNAYWLNAMEGWSRDPAGADEVRSYLSDYQAMTPADIVAAMRRHVADEGDWSMVVMPERK